MIIFVSSFGIVRETEKPDQIRTPKRFFHRSCTVEWSTWIMPRTIGKHISHVAKAFATEIPWRRMPPHCQSLRYRRSSVYGPRLAFAIRTSASGKSGHGRTDSNRNEVQLARFLPKEPRPYRQRCKYPWSSSTQERPGVTRRLPAAGGIPNNLVQFSWSVRNNAVNRFRATAESPGVSLTPD